MCGRYRLSRRKQIIEEHFDCVSGDEDWSPRYNVAPTQPVPIIHQHPKEPRRELSLVRWGLIPSWAKEVGVNWHWLRHANATLLDAVGTPLGTVQALLGHFSSEITRGVYLHSIHV